DLPPGALRRRLPRGHVQFAADRRAQTLVGLPHPAQQQHPPLLIAEVAQARESVWQRGHRSRVPPGRDQRISTTSNRLTPRGVFTRTVSPIRPSISASPIGLFTATSSSSSAIPPDASPTSFTVSTRPFSTPLV